jgi:redox-sensitive bicupin YhaK (pirin superfamily)
MNESNDKKIKFIQGPMEQHWVGNGFFVHTIFHPIPELKSFLSPFILMDYAPPKIFTSGNEKRGVGEHPHRGFETVTIVYSGEVDHRDSGGGGGRIGPGDVQWMTAAKGLVHEEFHSEECLRRGGEFEMIQLWVNLPKKDKMGPLRYQGVKDIDFPRIDLNDQSSVRLIAGVFEGQTGPCKIHTKMTVFDLDIEKDQRCSFSLEEETNTLIFVLRGELNIQGEKVGEKDIIIFERGGEDIEILAGEKNVKVLVLNGEPINEPLFAYGPFVMNTQEEIIEAIQDFNNGKMGHL